MGKKTRKTRWRTLPIGDEQSDSEESNSTLDTRVPPTYHQKYYNRFTYSSQSTPTRRYQSDSTKSTRSSSTASENKITFNEDEYTRITTPRQDVLFKKGYLNKPKTYSTQTSTGNSTNSTGNSTGNGTPEYQSTDLEYESQFVFPNGFLDQNGIYYVNSYDPYPLMVYNAPTYYNNDGCDRTKKYSTESLAETTSTSNEENSQEATNHNGAGHGDEVQGTPPPQQVNGHPHHHPQHHIPPPGAEYGQVYNVVYPGFYYNGLCPPQELVNYPTNHEEPKRLKRRRRRKLSGFQTEGQAQNGTGSEYTEDEFSSVEEEEEEPAEKLESEEQPPEDRSTSVSPPTENQTNENSEEQAGTSEIKEVQCDSNDPSDRTGVECDTDLSQQVAGEARSNCNDRDATNDTAENSSSVSETNKEEKKIKYDLKPDAQEFVPRALRPESVQYFKIQPSFVPLPLMGPMGPQNYGHPAYLPPGLPVGYIQQNPAIYPGYIPGYIPTYNPEHIQTTLREPVEEIPQMETEPEAQAQPQNETRNKNDVDIRTVVSKLEEVANDAQQPDRKNNRNPSQFKRTGQHRNYEERKKFFSKNNTQNGYYQKRTNGRYQNSNHNELNPSISVHKDDVIHENEECSKIVEEPIAECIQEEPENISETKIEPENTSSDTKELVQGPKIPEPQKETTKVNVQQESNGVPPNNAPQHEVTKEKIVNENKEINMSPKFQQRPTIANIVEGPKLLSKDNNYSDTSKNWPKREERSLQKRDQPIQSSDERYSQGYKPNESPTHRFNKKFTQNSPVKKPNATQASYYSSDNSRKYSETIKKAPQTTMIKPVPVSREIKPVIPEVSNTPMNKTQWISVSNKKKRRNKNVEDSENGPESPMIEEEERKATETKEIRIEGYEQNAFLQNMINGHSKVEDSESDKIKEEIPDIIRKSPVKILEVRDLEKELLSNVGVEIKDDNESLIAEVKIVEQQIKQKSNSKKKAKKGGQKQPTKRVFITDLDLSGTLPDTKKDEASKEDIKESEDVTETVNSKEVKKIEAENDTSVSLGDQVGPVEAEPEVVKQEVLPVEPTEKKSKKKKKKPKNSESISNTPTNAEDTYDILLENTLSNNSEDKTNMEISQELDLIIQRGMYSNLEEKIKALNIIPIKEEFFQSVVRSSRESSTEKTPEFTKLLANSMPKFKYCMASVEDEVSRLPLADFNQPSTSRNDLFVENSEVNELLKDIYGKEGTPEAEIGELVTRSTPPKEIRIETIRAASVEKIDVQIQEKNETDKDKLYPITQAVKNWMNKTRENTPEVEILKSPSKIFKEFCEIDKTNKNGLVNGKRNSAISESDEEITVYSASRNNSGAVDLLDCWENEISSDSGRQTSTEDHESKRNSDTNEDDEVLEVYESKYGQNEDFLELQREIEEKKKQEQDARSRNFPKHGALPYRAICCNVM